MSPRLRAFYIIPALLIVIALQAQLRDWLFRSDPQNVHRTISTQVGLSTAALFDSGPSPSPSPVYTLAADTPASPIASEESAQITYEEAIYIPSSPAVSTEDKARQIGIFTELWATVKEKYLYHDYNGLDWNAIRGEYRELIEDGLSFDDFYAAMEEMIWRLGDDHSVFLTPEKASKEDMKYAGNTDFVGIGVLLSAIPERQRAVILAVFPGGSAEEAGLQARDSILTVNGEAILDEQGGLKQLIKGPEGSQIALTVQSPRQPERELALTRKRVSGPIPVPYTVITTQQDRRLGYILLVTFADQTVEQQVGEALQVMSISAPLDGLILDNRYNEGGASTVLNGVLGYFSHGELGHFISREKEKVLRVEGRDLGGSQPVPLVILVGAHTYGYGEIFAGVLQDVGRAYIIGENTGGNVETLKGYNFSDGSRAWIAYTSFRPLNKLHMNWEGIGIVPDQVISSAWDDHPFESDPAVEAAIFYLSGE